MGITGVSPAQKLGLGRVIYMQIGTTVLKNDPLNNLLCGTVCQPELMQTDTLKQAGVYWSCDAADLSFVRISSEDNRTAEVF